MHYSIQSFTSSFSLLTIAIRIYTIYQDCRRAIRQFVQAKLLDCKISAYPNYTDEFRQGAHDSRIAVERGIIPSLLFIDSDLGTFDGNLDFLNRAQKF